MVGRPGTGSAVAENAAWVWSDLWHSAWCSSCDSVRSRSGNYRSSSGPGLGSNFPWWAAWSPCLAWCLWRQDQGQISMVPWTYRILGWGCWWCYKVFFGSLRELRAHWDRIQWTFADIWCWNLAPGCQSGKLPWWEPWRERTSMHLQLRLLQCHAWGGCCTN